MYQNFDVSKVSHIEVCYCLNKLYLFLNIMDLCRLCLKRCGAIGIVVYPNDIRREKIHLCLSIVVSTTKLLDFLDFHTQCLHF